MDSLRCEICSDWYNEEDRRPINLPCGHSYCKGCLAKEFEIGRRTCPYCRQPHNANSVGELPVSIPLQRMVRNLSNKRKLETTSDSEDEDFTGGPCSRHKKIITYFYCLTHSLEICEKCTVIDHEKGKCNFISIEDKIKKKKEEDVSEASSIGNELDDTLAALNNIVKVNQDAISEEELKIQRWKKMIDDSTMVIAQKKTAKEDAQREAANGQVQASNLEASNQTLKNAKAPKSITKSSTDLKNSKTNASKWIQDVQSKFKVHLANLKSCSPAVIRVNIKMGKSYCAETMIDGKKAIAAISSRNKKIEVNSFKHDNPPNRSITLQYDELLAHVPQRLPTLLFMDLKHRNDILCQIFIRIKPKLHTFIKHVPGWFTGLNSKGTSILGNKFCNGLSCNLVFYDGKQAVQDVASSDRNPGPTAVYGDVLCNFSGSKLNVFCIYTDDKVKPYIYSSGYYKIGSVESGVDVAVNARALGDQNEIIISECGIVLDN